MRGLMQGNTHYSDSETVEADPDKINEAFIAYGIIEDINTKEETSKTTDEDKNSQNRDAEPNICTVHFNSDRWEDSEDEEILWMYNAMKINAAMRNDSTDCQSSTQSERIPSAKTRTSPTSQLLPPPQRVH